MTVNIEATRILSENVPPNEIELTFEKWEKIVKPLFRPKKSGLLYLNRRFKLPLNSKKSVKQLVLDCWNMGQEVIDDLYLIANSSSDLDRNIFERYVKGKGIEFDKNSSVRYLAVKLFLLNPEFLIQGSKFSWKDRNHTLSTFNGPDIKPNKVFKVKLEKKLEDSVKQENLRFSTDVKRQGTLVKILIVAETRERIVLIMDNEKKVISYRFKPVKRLKVDFDESTKKLNIRGSLRNKTLVTTVRTTLGEILFEDKNSFPEKKAVRFEIRKMNISTVEDSNKEIWKDYNNIKQITPICIIQATITLAMETQPIIVINSSDVKKTLELINSEKINLDNSKKDKLILMATFQIKGIERQIKCEVSSSHLKVRSEVEDHFKDYLTKIGVLAESP